MIDDLRDEIYNQQNLKETDDLLEIWQTNDRVEWTDEAFEVIRNILQERLGELPQQDEPVFEHVADDDLGEDAPVFYKPKEVLWLATWVKRIAIIVVTPIIIANLLKLGSFHDTIASFIPGNMGWDLLAWLIALGICAFIAGLQGGLCFIGLRALGGILKMLMEMEFNSRGVG